MQAGLHKTRPEAGYYVWAFPGSPVRIHLFFHVISQINAFLDQIPLDRGPVQCQGLLLGGIEAGITRIMKFKMLENANLRTFEPALTELEGSMGGGPHCVGYFRVHGDGPLRFTEEELTLARKRFHDPRCVFLLVQRLPIGPANAGFFFWDQGKIHGDFCFMEFPFDTQLLAETGAIEAETVREEPVTDSSLPADLGVSESLLGRTDYGARRASHIEPRIPSGFGGIDGSFHEDVSKEDRRIEPSVRIPWTEAPAARATVFKMAGSVRRLRGALHSPILRKVPLAVSKTGAAIQSILSFFLCCWKQSAPWTKELSITVVLILGLLSTAGMTRSKNIFTAAEQVLGRMVQERATILLTDTLQPGLAGWNAAGKGMSMWSVDSEGASPGPLALYEPSIAMVNYRLEFITSITRGGIGWVVRARDPDNYYAMRLTVIRSGRHPIVSLIRYPVLAGSKGQVTTVQLRSILASATTWRVRVEVDGTNFKLFGQGELVDTWMSDEVQTGGVGFFTKRGEKAVVSNMSIASQDDIVGRICARLRDRPNESEAAPR